MISIDTRPKGKRRIRRQYDTMYQAVMAILALNGLTRTLRLVNRKRQKYA